MNALSAVFQILILGHLHHLLFYHGDCLVLYVNLFGQVCRYRYENNRVLEDISAEVDDLLNVHRRNPRGSTKETKNTFKQLRERQVNN